MGSWYGSLPEVSPEEVRKLVRKLLVERIRDDRKYTIIAQTYWSLGGAQEITVQSKRNARPLFRWYDGVFPTITVCGKEYKLTKEIYEKFKKVAEVPEEWDEFLIESQSGQNPYSVYRLPGILLKQFLLTIF